MGGSPKIPSPAAPATVAPAPPQLPSSQVQAAGQATLNQARSANGVASTIITGPQGVDLSQQNTAQKQLTGD